MAYSAALNTIYNHYLQTYPQVRPSRYDAHKKGELRSIYNSIIEQNRKSPLFLLENKKESHEFVVNLKENARELRNTIASLGGLDEGEILSKKAAFSSDPDIVSVNFVGDRENIDSAPEFEIFVNRLATGQANTGHLLKSDGKAGLPVDSYSFDVSINGTSYEFQFHVNEGEKNIDILNRLTRLFKNADIGLTAKIIEEQEFSALKLEANVTGTSGNRDFQFTISDEKSSKASGSVSYLGIDNVTQLAGNAEFLLNGEPKSAHSNHFTVEKMFELNLLGLNAEGTAPVQIGLKTSTESISENVTTLINGYNSFLEAVAHLSNTNHRSRQILSEMRGITNLYEDEMANLGLAIDDSGLLHITDNTKLGEILKKETEAGDEDGAEENDFSNAGLQTLKSFTNAILHKSNQVTLNPMQYVDKKIIAYKNPERAFVNPYMVSVYSGMMFNSYC